MGVYLYTRTLLHIGAKMRITLALLVLSMAFVHTSVHAAIYNCKFKNRTTDEIAFVFTVDFGEEYFEFEDVGTRNLFRFDNPKYNYKSAVLNKEIFLPHQGEIQFEVFNYQKLNNTQSMKVKTDNTIIRNNDGTISLYEYEIVLERNGVHFQTTLADKLSARDFPGPFIMGTFVKEKNSPKEEYIFGPVGTGPCKIVVEPSIKNPPSDYKAQDGMKIFN